MGKKPRFLRFLSSLSQKQIIITKLTQNGDIYLIIIIGGKGGFMHELGVLCQVVKKVSAVAEENNITLIKHITLEVGTESTFVPVFLEKLFPVATDELSLFKNSELRLSMVPGKNLVIKEIGY